MSLLVARDSQLDRDRERHISIDAATKCTRSLPLASSRIERPLDSEAEGDTSSNGSRASERVS